MALSPALQKLVSQGQAKYARGAGRALKPKEGINRWRILVPDPNAQFWADLGVHWIKADENGKPLAVVGCSDVCFQEPCEIDTAIDQAIASAIDEDSKKLYQGWRAKKSILVNILDRTKGSEKPDEVQIAELTPTTFAAILNMVQEYAAEGQDILDPNEGIDISITKTGKGLSTEYQVNAAAGTSKPVTKKQLSECHDLVEYIKKEFFKGEEQKALNQIAQLSGIKVARIGARTPTPALTSKAAAVEDMIDEDDLADAAEEEPKKPASKPTAAAEKPAAAKAEAVEEEPAFDADDVDDVLADLDNL